MADKTAAGPVETGGALQLSAAEMGLILRAVTARGRPFRFRANGSSMQPLIRGGDVLTVSPLNGGPLHAGDVVAFLNSKSDALLVHRVICSKNGHVVTQGDNSVHAETAFSKSDVAGRVIRVERQHRDVWFGTGFFGPVTALLVRSRIMARVIRPVFRVLSRVQRANAGRTR